MQHMPTEFPADAAGALVSALRGNANAAVIAEAAWNILGFCTAALVGSPGQAPVKILGISSGHAHDDDPDLSREEVLNILVTESTKPTAQRVYGAIPIPIKTLLRFALQILEEYVGQ